MPGLPDTARKVCDSLPIPCICRHTAAIGCARAKIGIACGRADHSRPAPEPRYDRDRLECASSRCQGEEAQLDVFSSCSRLEVIDISGSKVAVDVGRSKTGSGLRALAAACAATVLMSVSVTAALASSPPPPPPAPSGGGGGGTPPPANVTPSHPANSAPPDRRAPGKVGHLRTITKVAGRITLLWTNPGASDLAGVVVRRGWAGACPTSQHDGVAVGGTTVRTRQIDTGAVDGQRYCYAIFAFDHSGNYSRSAVAHSVMNPGDRTPPGPVTNFTAVEPGRPRRALVAKPAACRRRVRCRAPRYGHQQLPHRPARRHRDRRPGGAHLADRHHGEAGRPLLLSRVRARRGRQLLGHEQRRRCDGAQAGRPRPPAGDASAVGIHHVGRLAELDPSAHGRRLRAASCCS